MAEEVNTWSRFFSFEAVAAAAGQQLREQSQFVVPCGTAEDIPGEEEDA